MRIRIKPYVCSLGIALVLLLSQRAIMAQQSPNQPDLTIDAATRTAVIEGALKNLSSYYVFPETAKKMEQAVRERIAENGSQGKNTIRSQVRKRLLRRFRPICRKSVTTNTFA